MKSVPDYIRQLFLSKENDIDRRDYFSALGILWFLNISSLSRILLQFLIYYVQARLMSETTFTAAATLFSRTTSMYQIGIPWAFLLLTGSILLMHRVYGNKMHPVFQFVSGLLVFIFFRSLESIPFYFAGFPDLYSMQDPVKSMIDKSLSLFYTLIIPLSIGGLVLLLMPVFSLKRNTQTPDGIVQSRFSRSRFTLYFSCLSLASFAAFFLFFCIIHFLMNDRFDLPWVLGILGIMSLAILIVSQVFIIRRVLDTGYTLFCLVIYYLAAIIPGPCFLIYVYFRSLFLNELVNFVISVSFEITTLFVFMLFLLPSGKKLSTDPVSATE